MHTMRLSGFRRTAFRLLIGLVAAGCGTASAPGPAATPEPDECILVPPPPLRADTIRVALLQDVRRPGFPSPRNRSEQIVYRHLYETLIDVDCRGRPLPALAGEWSSQDGGRVWRFLLRPDARFWDGNPVTASRVVASWEASGAARHLGIELDSIRVAGATELTVHVDRSHQSIPLLFASPDLAVIAAPGLGEWPAGTGPYRIGATESDLALVLTAARETEAARYPPIRFTMLTGEDPRDVIDQGHDLLVTGDPRALDYARAQPEYQVVPLTWDQTHVVASPLRVFATGLGRAAEVVDAGVTGFPRRTLGELARDAVRAEARAAEPPYWWMDLSMCDDVTVAPRAPPAPTVGHSGTARIVYRSDDPTARDLAERLVALAALSNNDEILAPLGIGPDTAAAISRGDFRLSTLGLQPAAFDSAVRSGAELVYLFELPHNVTGQCQVAAELITAVPWLVRSTDSVPLSTLLLTPPIVPLVDTRQQAVVRHERIGLRVDWDGTVLLYRQ